MEATRVAAGHSTAALYGDQALLALGARRAAHFEQLLGPYSRAGFHHPGPALFYLLAPFVELAGSPGKGLYLGALAINLSAMVGAVSVVWRRSGPPAALWAAAAIDVFSACLGVGTLREPWNPYLVVVPMLLFLLLCAAAWEGSFLSAVWMLAVGSYELQTHIALTAPVAVLSAAAATRLLLHRRKALGEVARTRSVRAGSVLLVAIWTPVVAELFADHPDNAEKMWDFFTGRHPPVSWTQLLGVAGDALSVVPFGNRDYVLALPRSPWQLATSAGLVAGAALVTARVARRRADTFPGSLLKAAVIAGALGVVSLSGSDGPVYLYFALWLSVVPLAITVAFGAAVCGVTRRQRLAGDAGTWLRAAASAACAWSVASALSLGPLDRTVGSGPWPSADANSQEGRALTVADTAVFDQAVLGALRSSDRSASLTIGAPDVWPYAAGVALELNQRGIATSIGPARWVAYFGKPPGGAGTPDVTFWIGPAHQRPALRGGAQLVRVDGTVLTYARRARSASQPAVESATPGSPTPLA